MTALQSDLFIAGASFVGSAINAGAGGGSFISFPALLATGIAPISANATNNLAMSLGGIATTGSFRSEIDVPRATLWKMIATSVAGSVVGAIVLLRTTNDTFAGLIPYLLLAATVLFVAGPALTRASRRSNVVLGVASPAGLVAQFGIATYGGFFGAAIGILMLSLLGVLGMQDLRRANAFKVLLTTIVNGVAVVPFVLARVIAWEPAIVMSAGAIAGGFFGAAVVKRLPSHVVRGFVIAIACSMTAYFFFRTYVR